MFITLLIIYNSRHSGWRISRSLRRIFNEDREDLLNLSCLLSDRGRVIVPPSEQSSNPKGLACINSKNPTDGSSHSSPSNDSNVILEVWGLCTHLYIVDSEPPFDILTRPSSLVFVFRGGSGVASVNPGMGGY